MGFGRGFGVAREADTSANPVRLMAAVLLVMTGTCLPVFLASALGLQIKDELRLDDGAFGLALAMYFAAMSLSSVVGGGVADRVGWPRATGATVVLTVAGLTAMATLADSWWTLAACMVIGGASQGLGSPTANLAVAAELPVRRRGTVLAVKQSAAPVATLVAGIAVPIVALTIGWRWAFGFALLVPLAGALVMPKPTTIRMRHFAATPKGGVVDTPLLVLAVAGALAAISVGALATFLVLSAVANGLSLGYAGLLFAIASIVGLAVRVLGGMCVDRFPDVAFRAVALLLAFGALGLILMGTGRQGLIVTGAILSYGAGWGWPGLFLYGVVSSYKHGPATATGVTDSGMAAGTAMGPLAFGLLASPIGYNPSWVLFAGVMLTSAALVLWAGSATRRIPTRTAPGEAAGEG